MVEEEEQYLCSLGDNSVITSWSNIKQHDHIPSPTLMHCTTNAIISAAVSSASIYGTNVNDDCYTNDTIIDSNETTQYLALGDVSLEQLGALTDLTMDKMPLLEVDITKLTANDDSEMETASKKEIHESCAEDNALAKESLDIQNQILIFTINDELYGMQFVPDNDNPEKIRQYQFKLKSFTDGSLQIIPNTIQLINGRPSDVIEGSSNSLEEIMPQQQSLENCTIELEKETPKNNKDDEYFILESNLKNVNIYDKTEELLTNSQETDKNLMINNSDNTVFHLDPKSVLIVNQDAMDNNTDNQETLLTNEQYEYGPFFNGNDVKTENIVNDVETLDDPLMITDNMVMEEQKKQFVPDLNRTMGSEISSLFVENELGVVNVYQMQHTGRQNSKSNIKKRKKFVEHVHDNPIIENATNLENVVNVPINTSTSQATNNNNSCSILKHSPINNIKLNKQEKMHLKTNKSTVDSGHKYYIIYPEKENLNSTSASQNTATTAIISPPKLNKPNSRSLLKTSFVNKADQSNYPKTCTRKIPDEFNDIFQKRFSRSKEAVQAKLFQNFINRTTIPQAPQRQVRQPRKQKIMPINRTKADEEIIVKEVLIGSSGFIEDYNLKKMKTDNVKCATIAVQEISDSESDSSKRPALKNKRKGKYKKKSKSKKKLSIIEVSSSDENDDDDAANNKLHKTVKKENSEYVESQPVKRKRGRPPKYLSQIEALRRRKCIEIIEYTTEDMISKDTMTETLSCANKSDSCVNSKQSVQSDE